MQIEITSHLPAFRPLTQTETAEMNSGVAEDASELVRNHFTELDATRANKLGGKRTHYWGAARDSVHWALVQGGADINITQTGVRLHLYGGVVTPGKSISFITGKPTRMLTIPADAAAHGMRAEKFEKLDMLFFRGPGGKPQPYALAIPIEGTRIKGRGKKSGAIKTGDKGKQGQTIKRVIHEEEGAGAQLRRIMFWLVRKTTHTADRSVMPSDQEFEQTVSKSITGFYSMLASKWGRKGGAGNG